MLPFLKYDRSPLDSRPSEVGSERDAVIKQLIRSGSGSGSGVGVSVGVGGGGLDNC